MGEKSSVIYEELKVFDYSGNGSSYGSGYKLKQKRAVATSSSIT